MEQDFVYLTKEDILEYQRDIIKEIGGTHGTRDESGIDRMIDFIQNDLYYPTLTDKITYLVF
jgi:death-on-curing protein